MSKMVYVPPSGRRKGYRRLDPREKKSAFNNIIESLKNLLDKIKGLKKQGQFTKEQRSYIHKKLAELEPKLKHFKEQKQRMAIAKALKEVRNELDEKTTLKIVTKDKKIVPDRIRNGLKSLGYSVKDMQKFTMHEVMTVYYNEIEKSMNYYILEKGRSIQEWKEYLKIDEPEFTHPSNHVKTIGRSKKDGKWYGWSHRAINGFKTREQAKKFAESVS